MQYLIYSGKNWVIPAAVIGVVISFGLMASSYAAGMDGNSAFEQYDTNHDGYVSKEEATAHEISSQAFDDADSTHAGKLGKEEFAKAKSISDRRKLAKYVDDSVITAKVKTGLIKHSFLKGLQIHVQTYKGAVLLSGFVDSAHQAVAAGRVAAGVEGVSKVINSLIPKGAE